MAVRLSPHGVEQVIGGETFATIGWDEVVSVEGSCVDHMTQRMPMLTLSSASGEVIELAEGQIGWDAVLTELADHLPLTVADLAAAVAVLATGRREEFLAR